MCGNIFSALPFPAVGLYISLIFSFKVSCPLDNGDVIITLIKSDRFEDNQGQWDFPWQRLYVGVNLAQSAKFTPTPTTHHSAVIQIVGVSVPNKQTNSNSVSKQFFK